MPRIYANLRLFYPLLTFAATVASGAAFVKSHEGRARCCDRNCGVLTAVSRSAIAACWMKCADIDGFLRAFKRLALGRHRRGFCQKCFKFCVQVYICGKNIPRLENIFAVQIAHNTARLTHKDDASGDVPGF